VTDSADRRSPLAGPLPIDLPGVRIEELPFLVKTNVRGPIDRPLPTTPNTVIGDGDAYALWLGPDEWLVVGAPVEGVDVSAQYATIVLRGSSARDVLAHGCALDLDALDSGWCAQTMLAKANVILHGVARDEFRILVRASFARYLVAWLADAASSATSAAG
jgi:sarcosine oxidase subunit gamma